MTLIGAKMSEISTFKNSFSAIWRQNWNRKSQTKPKIFKNSMALQISK